MPTGDRTRKSDSSRSISASATACRFVSSVTLLPVCAIARKCGASGRRRYHGSDMPGSDRRVDFGYNPPSGTRGIEQFPTATFVRDLQDALDIASPSFSSFWVSDHLMTVDPFRMECWTQLTW